MGTPQPAYALGPGVPASAATPSSAPPSGAGEAPGERAEEEDEPGAGGADAVGPGVPEGPSVGRGGAVRSHAVSASSSAGASDRPARQRHAEALSVRVDRDTTTPSRRPGLAPQRGPPSRSLRWARLGATDVAAYLAATVSSTVAVTEVARRIAIGNVPRLLIGSTAMRRRSTVKPWAASASSMSREVTEP